MRALYLIVPILGILVIAYRYYSAFISARLWVLDDTRVTPAHVKNDGANFFPTSRWVLFGHHFAAIAGAGPLVGPVLAAQFGYAPGLLWLVGGVCLAGAVQDSFWLWASVRRSGRSLSDIARTDVSPVAGVTAGIAVLFILIVAMAGLGLAVVNALADSAWATFTVFMTIPLARAEIATGDPAPRRSGNSTRLVCPTPSRPVAPAAARARTTSTTPRTRARRRPGAEQRVA